MLKRNLITALVAACLATSAFAASPHDKAGFVTFERDGRLWVFKDGSKELADFEKHGEPTQVVTEIGTGPNGMTVKAADKETLKAYLEAAKS